MIHILYYFIVGKHMAIDFFGILYILFFNDSYAIGWQHHVGLTYIGLQHSNPVPSHPLLYIV